MTKVKPRSIPILHIGDKVKYNGKYHNTYPEWFPIGGTTGEVTDIFKNLTVFVQWEKGSTSRDDRWCCSALDLIPLENT